MSKQEVLVCYPFIMLLIIVVVLMVQVLGNSTKTPLEHANINERMILTMFVVYVGLFFM